MYITHGVASGIMVICAIAQLTIHEKTSDYNCEDIVINLTPYLGVMIIVLLMYLMFGVILLKVKNRI